MILPNDSFTIPHPLRGSPLWSHAVDPHMGAFSWLVLRGMPQGFENESPHKGAFLWFVFHGSPLYWGSLFVCAAQWILTKEALVRAMLQYMRALFPAKDPFTFQPQKC